MQKVCLDLHDWSVVNNRLDLLLRLRDHFPSFKVSLFTVPIEDKQDWGSYLIREDFLNEIKKHLDWIQIIPHGLRHDRSEMLGCSYLIFKNEIVPKIRWAFEELELPFVEGFCAPHWRWSKGVVEVLDELGWWGAVDPRQPDMPCPKRFYKYSHAIDSIDLTQEILKLHGHVYGTKNDLGRCFNNLLSLPQSVEWHFITDFLEER
jgi:hypothetical protein